jgi:hypothetical protein
VSSAAGSVSFWRNLWGGPVCAVIVTTDELDSPIAFDRLGVRILVDLCLAIAEVFNLVRLWLLYCGIQQPANGLVCWCGEVIELPQQPLP